MIKLTFVLAGGFFVFSHCFAFRSGGNILLDLSGGTNDCSQRKLIHLFGQQEVQFPLLKLTAL